MTHIVSIGGGCVRVPHETYELYLGGAASAALVDRDGQVLLLPLRGPVAGGMLLKQRNLRGDRVMLASDFLAGHGIDPFAADREFNVRWIAEAGALLIEGLEATRLQQAPVVRG
jgi:hypothetical protein